MMHFNRKTLLVLLLVVMVFAPAVTAETSRSEDDVCPQIVTQALDATNLVCDGTGRNEACYGNVHLDAQAQPDVDDFTFAEVGDLEDVAAIQSLRLSGMDVDAGVWGVALMRLRANIPAEERSKNVTLLLFGDVELENAVAQPVVQEITAPTSVNVRATPSTDGYAFATLQAGSVAVVDGRSSDNEWLHVLLADGEQEGWVYTSVVMNPENALSLDVVDNTVRTFQPMQAFYFQSGVDDASCPEAPNSGLVIQTPEGVAQVTFLINEVDIQLGSTVYFQADPGNEMTVSVVEGSATVRAFGVVSKATAGAALKIPISDELQASGPPGLPYAYEMASVKALPLQGLERAVEVHTPLNDEEVDELLDEVVALNEEEAASEGEAGVNGPGGGDGRDPIQGGGTQNNPIFGENTPGNGGTPPGQEKKN